MAAASAETDPLMFEMMREDDPVNQEEEPPLIEKDHQDFDLVEMSFNAAAICQGSCLSDPQVI